MLPTTTRTAVADIAAVLQAHRQAGDPLPRVGDHDQRARLATGWDPDDRLMTVSLNAVANEAGLRQFDWQWLPSLRGPTQETVPEVGTDRRWGRYAQLVPTAGGDAQLPWTLPLHGGEVVALARVVRSACIIVIAAISGMRASELMELVVGCRRPHEASGDRVRYRLASKVVKGQPLGGTEDEWVVIEAVHHAAGVAEQLLDQARAGDALFGRFGFRDRYRWFRAWVNGPAGARLGLAPIPDGNVTPRILRRTLAIDLTGIGQQDRPILLPLRSSHGQGGSSRTEDIDVSLWIQPLPPSGPVTISCSWSRAGIEHDSVSRNGHDILAAAQTAQTFYSTSES